MPNFHQIHLLPGVDLVHILAQGGERGDGGHSFPWVVICIVYFPRAPYLLQFGIWKTRVLLRRDLPWWRRKCCCKGYINPKIDCLGVNTHKQLFPHPLRCSHSWCWASKPRHGVSEEELEYFIFLRHFLEKFLHPEFFLPLGCIPLTVAAAELWEIADFRLFLRDSVIFGHQQWCLILFVNLGRLWCPVAWSTTSTNVAGKVLLRCDSHWSQ